MKKLLAIVFTISMISVKAQTQLKCGGKVSFKDSVLNIKSPKDLSAVFPTLKKLLRGQFSTFEYNAGTKKLGLSISPSASNEGMTRKERTQYLEGWRKDIVEFINTVVCP